MISWGFLPTQADRPGWKPLQTGQPQASKNGARFFCTFSENFLTHRFILPGLSLGMSERVWYSAKNWVNGFHPKASWSWKSRKGQNEV